ncbi:hypothetical protein NQZ79_g7946 [Umbelopsis isabellina]|nr:hypothetical protein NQZ79_g7946 [Umbelopsis isabellina]
MPSSNPSSDQQLDLEFSNLDSNVPTDNAVHELEQKLEQQHISIENSSSECDHDIQADASLAATEVKNTDSLEATPQETTDRTTAEQTDEYLLKEIDWINPKTGAEKRVKIITQNIAIGKQQIITHKFAHRDSLAILGITGNVLILRGDIRITPFDRPTVTFEYLASQLGDYLLRRSPQNTTKIMEENDESPQKKSSTHQENSQGNLSRQKTDDFVMDYRYNLNNALSIIPNLRSGLASFLLTFWGIARGPGLFVHTLDINVYFNSIYGFEPTKELALFDLFHVDLVHGWVVDPEDNETQRVVVDKCGSYNSAVEHVISSDIASQQQASNPEADDIDPELIHSGKRPKD